MTMSILASPPSLPENLQSYNDEVKCAVQETLMHPSPAAESISIEMSGNICCTPVKERELRLPESDEMREASQELIKDFEDHKTTPLRQSSLSSSPLLADVNYYKSSKMEISVNSRLKRKTPEVCMDDLEKLRVGEANLKCKPRTRKTIRHENRQPRYTIKTVSEREIIDDGYRWRKYGRKRVKESSKSSSQV